MYTWVWQILDGAVGKKWPKRRRIQDSATQPCTCVSRGKSGAACFAKLLSPAGSINHARRLRRVSICHKNFTRGKRSYGRQHGHLHLRLVGVPTAPHLPSWSPTLVDEAGVLKSRPLRFASSFAASCQFAVGRLFAINDERSVGLGFRTRRIATTRNCME